jgi:hypothetical protein|tara:strand:- start:446 stop:949 length:504 start_codon:yes stop_codon:yes gene_type:complete
MSPYFEDLKLHPYHDGAVYNKIWDPETKWVEYFNFTACLIDNDIMMKDHFYKWLYERHPFKTGVLKMEHKTMYNWHADSTRGVCINSIIQTPNTSFTFFRGAKEVNHGLIELQYYPGARFLFNNQKEHMVLNYDGDRYVLTTEFLEDKDELTYIDLLKEIENDYYKK